METSIIKLLSFTTSNKYGTIACFPHFPSISRRRRAQRRLIKALPCAQKFGVGKFGRCILPARPWCHGRLPIKGMNMASSAHRVVIFSSFVKMRVGGASVAEPIGDACNESAGGLMGVGTRARTAGCSYTARRHLLLFSSLSQLDPFAMVPNTECDRIISCRGSVVEEWVVCSSADALLLRR